MLPFGDRLEAVGHRVPMAWLAGGLQELVVVEVAEVPEGLLQALLEAVLPAVRASLGMAGLEELAVLRDSRRVDKRSGSG